MRSEVGCPSGWETIALGDLVDLQKGRKVDTFESPIDEAVPYLGAASFSDSPSRWTASDDAIICGEDDTLLLWDGERSGLSAAGLSGAVSSTVMRLRPSSRNLHPGFLSVAMHDCYGWIQQRRTGSGIPHVPKDLPRILRLWVPPLPEQKKIAFILSSVDEAIEATQAVIEQTRRVKEGLLQDLLTRGIGHTRFKQTEIGEVPEGWKLRKLGTILPTSDGIKPGPFGSSLTKSKFVPAGFKVYGQEQVLAGDLTVGSYYIAERHYQGLHQFAVEAGDVLLTLVGAGTPGKVLIVKPPFEPGLINPRLIRIRTPSKVLSPQFLARVFEAPFTQREILRVGQGGAMPVLSAGLVRSLRVPLPPLAEQAQIVRRLDEWDEGIRTTKEVLQRQVTAKAGLLQDLLTGKVRVTV